MHRLPGWDLSQPKMVETPLNNALRQTPKPAQWGIKQTRMSVATDARPPRTPAAVIPQARICEGHRATGVPTSIGKETKTMGCLFFPSLILSLPLYWFYPEITSVIVGLAWLLLFLVVFWTQRTAKFESDLLTYDEEIVASKYVFYFRTPLTSMNISNGAAPWQVFTIVWVIYLGCIGLWWYLPITAAVFVICACLRITCHPLFFAQEGVRKFSGTPEEFEYREELYVLKEIHIKLYDDYDATEEAV